MRDPDNAQCQFLTQVLAQNAHAVAFCETVFGISQTLDDIIDGDTQLVAADARQSAATQFNRRSANLQLLGQVAGKGKDGKVQLFIEHADKEALVVLLERAKAQLVKLLE